MNELVQQLQDCDIKYELGLETGLDDCEYDQLKQQLIDSGTIVSNGVQNFCNGQVLGLEKLNDVKLPYIMGSLNKTHDFNYLPKYCNRFVISSKLDGYSSLIYQKRIYSRGNGVQGRDISYLMDYVSSFSKIPYDMAVRGELIISVENFNKIQAVTNGKFSNPRNAVSGIVNSKHSEYLDILKYIDFVPYQILNNTETLDKQLSALDDLGIPVVDHLVLVREDMEPLDILLDKLKQKSKYQMDGLVLTRSDIDISQDMIQQDRDVQKLSKTQLNPKHSRAYKQNDYSKVKITKVKKVNWNQTQQGYLIPVLQIEPVVIDGRTIKSVTASNAKKLFDSNIRVGTQIEVIMSGDIIPKIHKVLGQCMDNDQELGIPDGVQTKWNGPHLQVQSIQEDGNEQRLLCQLKKLEIKGIGPGIAKQLGYNDISECYQVIDKYPNIMDAFRQATLEQLLSLYPGFVNGFSIIRLQQIFNGSDELKNKVIRNVYINGNDDYENIGSEDVKGIKGIGSQLGLIFVNQIKGAIEYVKVLVENYELVQQNTKPKNQNTRIIKIALSGTRDKKSILDIVGSYAIEFQTNVTKTTDILVIHQSEQSRKYEQAKQYGIPIVKMPDDLDQLDIIIRNLE